MIRGRVSPELRPLVTIDIENGNGVLQSLEVIVDTGFNGDLTLPSGLIRRLRLPYSGQDFANLADGRPIRTYNYAGVVSWHEKPRNVTVIETDGEPLLGMSLLLDSKLTVSARPGGEVVIEEEEPGQP